LHKCFRKKNPRLALTPSDVICYLLSLFRVFVPDLARVSSELLVTLPDEAIDVRIVSKKNYKAN